MKGPDRLQPLVVDDGLHELPSGDPHIAGGSGRAIYNDVDQVYLADPGELFDACR